MEAVKKADFVIKYNGHNITKEISRNLISLRYTDKTEGESDEVEIQVEDAARKWQNEYYPTKGDTIELSIGSAGLVLPCGKFQIDEVEFSGTPDVITIRGLAVPVKGSLRSKKSSAHENTTLKQIAEAVAQKNGLKVVGDIAAIQFQRITQNRESDLCFLNRIAREFGYIFNIRADQLIFTNVFKIEKGKPVLSIDRTDIIPPFNLKDSLKDSYSAAVVKYHNPTDGKVVEYKVEAKENADAVKFNYIQKGDTLEIKDKAENKQQAEAKAKAALHRANSKQQSGRITVPGTLVLVAGNNFELTGFGQLSGVQHITQSEHAIDKSGGYTTGVEFKRVGFVELVKQKAKSPRKKKNYSVKVVE